MENDFSSRHINCWSQFVEEHKKMKNLIRLSEYSRSDVENIFHIADELQRGKYKELTT